MGSPKRNVKTFKQEYHIYVVHAQSLLGYVYYMDMERMVEERTLFTVLFQRPKPGLPETSTAIGCQLNHSYCANFLLLWLRLDTVIGDRTVVKALKQPFVTQISDHEITWNE